MSLALFLSSPPLPSPHHPPTHPPLIYVRRHFRIAENFEVEPGYLAARDVIAKGTIGDMAFFRFTQVAYIDEKDNPYYKTPWRTKPEYEGGESVMLSFPFWESEGTEGKGKEGRLIVLSYGRIPFGWWGCECLYFTFRRRDIGELMSVFRFLVAFCCPPPHSTTLQARLALRLRVPQPRNPRPA